MEGKVCNRNTMCCENCGTLIWEYQEGVLKGIPTTSCYVSVCGEEICGSFRLKKYLCGKCEKELAEKVLSILKAFKFKGSFDILND